MFHHEVLPLKDFRPPGYLTFWVFEIKKPFQSRTVSSDYKSLPMKIRVEMLNRINHCKQM
jgi:hypothetical protein